MKAVVMAGGEGSRLRPLTSRRPKPLLPVAGTPVVEHILALLREHGITDVVVTLQYLGSELRSYLGDGSDYGMTIEYVAEDSPMGTAGSVFNARHLVDDSFLVISGDAMTDIDLTTLVERHRNSGAAATIALTEVRNPREFGLVVTEATGQVTRFLEKPSWGEVISDRANTGIYVLEPTVLEHIEPGVPCDWSQHVFPRMLERGDPVLGAVVDGYWTDIGSVPSYLQANWDALEGRVRCQRRGEDRGNGVWIGEGVEFGMGVRIEGPAYLGDEAKIKANAFLNGPVVVDRFSVVDANAKVSNTVIWPRAYIGEGCRLRQSIICRNVTIKNNCLLEDNTVIGDECVIGRAAHIGAGVKIWPHKEIEQGSTVTESLVWAGEWRRGLFSSIGMSGLVNVEFTPEFCARLGAAFGASLPKGSSVTVGRDEATSSRMIKHALVAGMVSAGARVTDLIAQPVPVTQWATRFSHCAAGLHVLSSPLDQRSADIRFFDAEGMQLDRRAERRLENLFFREDFRRAAFYEMGGIEESSPLRGYAGHVLTSVDAELIRGSSLRLLVDYDHSAASSILPPLLNTLDISAVSLRAGFSERGRHEHDDAPADETVNIARTLRADLGVVINASGERLTLIDETGVVLDPHQAIAVVAMLLLNDLPGGLVRFPASVPEWVREVIAAHGGSSASTAENTASVVRGAFRDNAVLGCDGEGGFVWPKHLGAFDAVYTVVRLLELRARSSTSLSELRLGLPRAAYVTATEFCPWEVKGTVMRVLLEQHRGQPVDLVDGIKLHVPGGFVLVVPDPDAPAYRIVASVPDPDEGERLVADYAARVRAAQGEGGGPG